MRIGLSTSVIQRGRSGIGQYVLSLVRVWAAQRLNHQFVLYVLEEDLPLFDSVRNSMQLVPVPERFRPPTRNILWHQRVLPQLARVHQLDVLHVPSYRRMLWPRPCALVATIHDLAPFRVPRKYDATRMFYGRVVARWLARRQHEIIAVSQATSDDVTKFFGVEADRLTVIYNGIDHDRFSPAPRGIARAVGIQRFGLSQPFFLYVARIEHPAKNHACLIRAFNQFKAETGSSWQLVFAGSDWHGAEFVHAARRDSPFAGDIRSLGFVPDEELPMLYRAAEVFVYPSLHEGFGLPPLEAMACGCPVLCSTRGALGEVVGNAAATADPEEPSALAQQMAQLAADEALRDRLRDMGLERARHFDWNHTAARTLEVYARAAERVKNAAPRRALVGQWSHG